MRSPGGSRGARGGLACPESLWESRSRAGASAPKLSSFFPGTKPRCEQDKLEEGVSSPSSLASGWPAPRKCRGVGGSGSAKPCRSAPAALASLVINAWGGEGGGNRTKIALIKLRVWKLFLRLGSGQPFGCAGLGCSRESPARAVHWVFGFCSFR